ncbi:MAG: transporter substrate-binding domain-containing protein [Candidatus Pelagadaptatus aseana]
MVRVPRQEVSNVSHTGYILTLLKQALEKSKANGELINVQQAPVTHTQARMIAELIHGQSLDVIWTMTSRKREQLMLPIRVPILKGLLGQRVFLIRQEHQSRFDNIHQLSDLAQLSAGQGSHWPDTDILIHNGLSVSTNVHYERLFDMLAGGRFDYFPRGANEAWVEAEAHREQHLAVEQNLILSYIAPVYFFVAPDNLALAQRIQSGLDKMHSDGSFDALFFNDPTHANTLKQLATHQRRVFKLENPLLPLLTPVDITHYWLPAVHGQITMD